MATQARATIDPGRIRGLATAATVTVILLACGWLIGALWSVVVAGAHIDPPSTFEDMTPVVTAPLALGLWVGFLASGTLWAVGQRTVALAALPGGVRDPDWQAYAWFSPIVMWWEPVRNVRELSSYLLPPARRWLVPAWWASWIAFRITVWLVMWQLWMPPQVLLVPWTVGLAASLATVLSATLAVLLIQTLTRGALARVQVPLLVTYVRRPYPLSLPLFISGILCRVATPLVVIGIVTLMADRFG